MNAKLKNSKSRMVVVANGIHRNLKQQGVLRSTLLTITKPIKYIVTLQPRGANLKSQVCSKVETQKVIINARNVLKDTNFSEKSPILEKIVEESVKNENYDLNLAQSQKDIHRLRAGWSLGNRKSSKKHTRTENEGSTTNYNEMTTTEPEQTLVAEEDTEISLNIESSQLGASTNITLESDNNNSKTEMKLKETPKHILTSMNGLEQTSNNDDINMSMELKQLLILESKFDLKETRLENNNHTESELNDISPSFVENIIEEVVRIPAETTTLPSSSVKCALKDLMPICGENITTQSHCDLLSLNSNDAKIASALFCILPSDKEICKRIDNLEKQVKIIHVELKGLQKELLPLEDLAKFSILSKAFNEVNVLLTDLKLNCLKLKNMEMQRGVESRESNEVFFQQNNQSIMNISLNDDTEKLFCPRTYLDTCNCSARIYQTSQRGSYGSEKLKDDLENTLKKCPTKCTQRLNFTTDMMASSMHYIPNNIDDFKYPQTCVRCSCCKNCQFYTEFNTEQRYYMEDENAIEKSGLETQLAMPSTSHNHNTYNSISQQSVDKYFSSENTSPDVSVKYRTKSMENANRIADANVPSFANINIPNQKMPEPNATYAKIQSIRVKNLEQQIVLMHRELQRIHERMLPQKDLIRLANILERLKELNLSLTDLRNHYYNFQQSASYKKDESKMNQNTVLSNELYLGQQRRYINKSLEDKTEIEPQVNYESNNKNVEYHPRKKAGYDQKETLNTSEQQQINSRESLLDVQDTEINKVQKITDNKKESNEPFKTCKQLMSEIKPPGSILGHYLMKLQDFRTDPELRRQRWQKKQQEKLQKLQKQRKLVESLEDKKILTEGIMDKQNSYSSLADTSDVKSEQYLCPTRHKSETTAFGLDLDLPLIKNNLPKVVFEIINDIEQDAIALTIVLENDSFYHINVSLISSGHSLSCFLATEEAIQEAKQQHLFQNLLTFFVVNAENSEEQKDRILGHSFEFIKTAVN